MSIKIMSWLWENSPHKGSELLLLLAIADSANDEGIAWPGLAKLSKKVRLGRRHIIDLIDSLEKSGAIEVQRRKDGKINLSNVYKVVTHTALQVVSTDAPPSEPQNTTPSEPQNTKVVNHSSPKSSVKRKSEPSNKPALEFDIADDFLSTWKALFPEKPQPRPETIREKLKARMKGADFAENWKAALERAAKTRVLHNESWFNLTFLLRNDENLQKVLDGWMDWKDGETNNGKGKGAGATPPVTATTGNGSAMRI
jgi:hypothetical protein